MSRIRTCGPSRARQVLLLPSRRRLGIGFGVRVRRKRLPVCAVHGRGRSHSPPNGMRRDESLRLSRDRCEDAVLVEPHAV
jgi:hypothetical protein